MQKSFKDRFKRLYDYIETDIDSNPSMWLKLKITLDFLWEKIINKNELIDYIQYRFYYKTRPERNKFVTHSKLLKIMRICNDPNSRIIFDSKPLFNDEFKKYLGRDYLDTTNSNDQEIENFIKKHNRVIAKSPDGMFGKGIEFFEVKDIKFDEDFFNLIKKNKYLLEEILTQNIELKEFNASSVNTLRVVTLINSKNEVQIMCGVLRLGRQGQSADNFHHYGIASLIDVETGIVYTDGVDRNWDRYVIHPDSKKTICGFKIPQWEDIKALCIEAAKVHPEVRYVGWDVSLKENGQIVLIEGNPGQILMLLKYQINVANGICIVKN